MSSGLISAVDLYYNVYNLYTGVFTFQGVGLEYSYVLVNERMLWGITVLSGK